MFSCKTIVQFSTSFKRDFRPFAECLVVVGYALTLKSANNAQTADTTALEQRISALEAEIQSLRDENSTLQENYETVQGNYEAALREIEEKSATIAQQQTAIAERDATIAELTAGQTNPVPGDVPTQMQLNIAGSVLKNAKFFNGHAYLFYDSMLLWNDAKTYCESLGGHLATITSEEEQMFIVNYLVSVKPLSTVWIGLRSWWTEWITGEAVGYSNWGDGEPDNSGGQDYGAIVLNEYIGTDWHIRPGQWDDLGNELNYFICEWD